MCPLSLPHLSNPGKPVCTNVFHAASPPQRYKYVLVVVCMLSHWTKALPGRQATASSLAKILLERTVPTWGAPSSFVAHREPIYRSAALAGPCCPPALTTLPLGTPLSGPGESRMRSGHRKVSGVRPVDNPNPGQQCSCWSF